MLPKHVLSYFLLALFDNKFYSQVNFPKFISLIANNMFSRLVSDSELTIFLDVSVNG